MQMCSVSTLQSGEPATLMGAPAAVKIEAPSYSCSNSDSLPLPCTLFIDRTGQVLNADGHQTGPFFEQDEQELVKIVGINATRAVGLQTW